MAKLTLVLVTQERKLLEIECDSVTLPGSEGYLGVLPGHTPSDSNTVAGNPDLLRGFDHGEPRRLVGLL